MSEPTRKSLSYRDAGVDIEAGERLVEAIKPLAANTQRKGTLGALGGFGALFDLKAEGWRDPVLVSGTDGVGTKLMLAFQTGKHDTIGIDLVAMCANDVLAQGAEPLFFLDYFATGHLETGIAESVLKGIAEGCRQAGCALIGGETAEMPGMYATGHYDLAGFVVGAAEREAILPNHAAMAAGDLLIGLKSSGPHANGYSLIRKVIAHAELSVDAPCPYAEGTLGEALLTPTRLYSQTVLPLLKTGGVHGIAHITGGGLTENIPRMCPPDLVPRISASQLPAMPVFEWLAETGNIAADEMHRTFNMGIGMVLAIDPARKDELFAQLRAAGEAPLLIGQLDPA